MKLKTGPPYTEDKRRLKEEENHATLVGGRFNEQRNLHEACQGSPKRIRYSYTPARILKPHREDLTELSHLSGPDSLSNTALSQGCNLGSISYCGNSGQSAHSKTERCKASECLDLLLSRQSHPLRDPLQQFQFTPAIISFRILRNVLNITNFTFPIVKTDRITYF